MQIANKFQADRRLDLLTFAVSGLRDGLGPLLGVFLIQKTQWDAFQISIVLATAGITNLILQIPVGLIYDTTQNLRMLIAFGGCCLAFSCFLVSLVPPFPVAILSQILVGIGGCLLSVGLPALTIRSIALPNVGKRFARNEIFSKLGNFCSIGLMGVISQRVNLQSMFYVIYLAAGLVIATSLPKLFNGDMKVKKINGLAKNKEGNFLLEAFKNRKLVALLFASFTYQLANASMFMIFEQQWVRKQINGGIGLISSSLLVTQITIVLFCLYLNRSNKVLLTRRFMQIGFSLILLRGCVLLLYTNVFALFVSQLLDGVIAALLIVVPISSLTTFAEARFNRMSALLGTTVVAAASLSTLCAGYVITHAGFTTAYAILMAIACFGLFWSTRLENIGGLLLDGDHKIY